MFTKKLASMAFAASALFAVQASAGSVYITEWAYQGGAGEFVELTNLGNTAINFSGWVFDDDSRITTASHGAFDLSSFGTVAAGESVIFTEASASAFRSYWGLSASVKVVGGVTNNLGRADEINIYDNAGQLVDRLAYGDEAFPGTIRTQTRSGRAISQSALGANNPALWALSSVGDVEGSWSVGGSIASPGRTAFTPPPAVPVPAAAWLFGSALLGLGCARRRKA
jgi:predicted extracellular nuclease